MAPSSIFLLLLMLLLNGTCSAPNVRLMKQNDRIQSISCVGCVFLVSLTEQLAQVHNSTAKEAMARLCGYLLGYFKIQSICLKAVERIGPHIIEMIEQKKNPDVVCHSIKLCKQTPGQPLCHIYRLPKEGLDVAIKESEEMIAADIPKNVTKFDICSLPFLKSLCEKIKFFIKHHLPFIDMDGDKFSTFPTLRGYDWRGRDCDDRNASVYPGRRPDKWDVHVDSNCNGIWGVDPKDGLPYEQKFCNGTESMGIILLGDSAGAHFHIPPEWITASQMSEKSFSNLFEAIFNEFDWPQFSAVTGFHNSTVGGWTDSVYLHLLRRNLCNHRDYQNIAINGGNSNNILNMAKSMARNQQNDKPAVVIYELIGNDVCNRDPNTVNHMTPPEKMKFNTIRILQYLDTQLPKGSHVLLVGLVDGRFIWDNLHNRYHPLGQLNKDITYEQLYSFLSCLQFNSCIGWTSPNSTLRNITSERTFQLSKILRDIAKSEKFVNFDVAYMDFPMKEIIETWQKSGGETWQLIEPVDGFHPNQIASALSARFIGQKIIDEWPHIFGKVNPFNDEIAAQFKDQGGY